MQLILYVGVGDGVELMVNLRYHVYGIYRYTKRIISNCNDLLLVQLLEECTAKLGLVSAARRLYLSDGTLIREFSQIMKNSDVYVSCGDTFKDPFGKFKGA